MTTNTVTLVKIAIAWEKGRLTDEQARSLASNLEVPTAEYDFEGVWYDGEYENTIDAVSAFIAPENVKKFDEVIGDYGKN